MTTAAIRNATTERTLARTTDLVAFINQHGDKLGSLAVISTSGILTSGVQIEGYYQSEKNRAGALITWLYLLDGSSLSLRRSAPDDVSVDVRGRLGGHEFRAHSGFKGATAAYLFGLAEVSVHALRRIQIGDVPALDTAAVQR